MAFRESIQTKTNRIDMAEKEKEMEDEEFYPKGALAFFIVMIVMFLVMWFSLYFELLGRG